MLSAIEITATILEGKTTAVEQLETHSARVDAVNPKFNVLVWQDREGAMAEARAATRKRPEGRARCGCTVCQSP
ncbi:hypothetical protein GV827_15395 [Sulfitobacter sp. JBTF-M27]|uniref:Amidase n=1 Tax=Sulfitobacter sediminilitoris TaxID=2698830 RepID=A0A6P0CC27_9RHOB|nr:hypothetical protein [Sulfitobacter sediminilitoris]NEK23781.1 hypothetical protein [Sulfitobacter sediminilitoris]